MAGNPDFNTLITTTLQRTKSEFTDAVSGNQAFWAQLRERGFITEEEGSREIVENLMIEVNDTVKSYDGYDILDVTPQEGFTAAVYSWKQLAGSVTLSGKEEFQNSGSKTQVIKLVTAKIEQLKISMALELNRMLFADGTGNGGKDIHGLNALVEDGGAWSVIGGIDSATTTVWRNQWQDFDTGGGSDVFETVSGKSTAGVRQIRNLINKTARGKDRPTLLVTAQEVYEAYEATLEDKRRFTDGRLGDLGFVNILFDQIPMIWDPDVPTDDDATSYTLFALNSNYLKWVIGRGKNMVATPFMSPINQDARTSKVLLYSNVIVNNRARQGRMTNIKV